jgi:hypothetical protein
MADIETTATALTNLSIDDITFGDGGVPTCTYPKILTLDIGGRKFKV